jgi:hypothetical protein
VETTEIKRGYWTNGQLRCEFPEVNGKQYGRLKWWHTSGQLSHEYPYVNNKQYGLIKSWRKSGQLDFVSIRSKDTRKIRIDFIVPSIKNTTDKPLLNKELWKKIKNRPVNFSAKKNAWKNFFQKLKKQFTQLFRGAQ